LKESGHFGTSPKVIDSMYCLESFNIIRALFF
jgi:hypothetical protein